MLARHSLVRAAAMPHVLRVIDLDVCLGLEVLASHVACLLLRAVGEGHLVDWATCVLHAHVVGVAMLLPPLVTATFHREP